MAGAALILDAARRAIAPADCLRRRDAGHIRRKSIASRCPRHFTERADHRAFEETYPKYEFSELVRLGMALAAWIGGMRRRPKVPRPDPLPVPTTRTELHAE